MRAKAFTLILRVPQYDTLSLTFYFRLLTFLNYVPAPYAAHTALLTF